jgi:hypothetical protein
VNSERRICVCDKLFANAGKKKGWCEDEAAVFFSLSLSLSM